MRTKTLLLSAAVFAAGIALSTAQSVYSINSVGYVNLNLTNGFTMIANPLNSTNNHISVVIPTVPDFTILYKFNPTNQQYFDSATYIGGWDVDYSLAPGEGAFIQVPSPTTITFVGEVPQGSLTTPLYANYQIAASQVPQQGGLTATLGYTPDEFDVVFKFDPATQQFENSYNYFGGAWDPTDPILKVGESCFIQRSASGNWTRTFSVN
jgi:hypothetical protein